jgi:hypothetical protein
MVMLMFGGRRVETLTAGCALFFVAAATTRRR